MGNHSDGVKNFINAWFCVILSLSYCFAIGRLVPKGWVRLILLLPVFYIFLLLPLHISSVHLAGITAFFVAWLANFKLLLFAFGRGPLSTHPPLSFSLFLPLSSLPIKTQTNPKPPVSHPNAHSLQITHLPTLYGHNSSPKPRLNCAESLQPYSASERGGNITTRPKSREGPLSYAIKGVLLILLVNLHDYSVYLHPKAVLALYAFHIYFILELILAVGASVARATSGLELEPQFDEPYLATSLQDFWGRRWNLMVTRILHPTVYEPALWLFSGIIGRKWAPLPAVFGTFVVSAFMHELMFYYMGRLRPAWKVTWFFLIHGCCLTVEIAVKKTVNGRWGIPRAAARVLTVGMVMVTGLWLFVPEFTRCKIDKRAFEEYAAIGAFAKHLTQRI